MYQQTFKQDALAILALVGSFGEAERLTGVGAATLRRWVSQAAGGNVCNAEAFEPEVAQVTRINPARLARGRLLPGEVLYVQEHVVDDVGEDE